MSSRCETTFSKAEWATIWVTCPSEYGTNAQQVITNVSSGISILNSILSYGVDNSYGKTCSRLKIEECFTVF